MTNCRSGRRAASTGPPFVRTAEPLEQGDAKATFVGSAGSQGDGVDLVLKDVVLGVHGGVTGPGLERRFERSFWGTVSVRQLNRKLCPIILPNSGSRFPRGPPLGKARPVLDANSGL